jgi:DNA helicase-2/ATP-dependent DNA helicase PcrA
LKISLRDVFYRLLSRAPFAQWQEDPNRTFRLGQLSAILDSFASVEDSDQLRVSSAGGRFSQGWLRSRFYPRLIGYLHSEELDDPEDVDYEIKPGAIQVMTVHQSKGLEFPIVFVGSMTLEPEPDDATYQLEELLGPFSANQAPQASAADRAAQDLARFFYVAYTRAQNLLVLFGTTTHFKKAVTAVGR